MPPKGKSWNQAELFFGMPGQNSLCPAEVWQHHSKFQLCCYCGLVRIKAKAQEQVLSPTATHSLEFLRDFYLGSLCSLIPLRISLLLSKGIWLSNWSSAWSHAGQGPTFTSQRLLGAICLISIPGRWEAGRKDCTLTVCFIFNRNFLGWALPFRLD